MIKRTTLLVVVAGKRHKYILTIGIYADMYVRRSGSGYSTEKSLQIVCIDELYGRILPI